MDYKTTKQAMMDAYPSLFIDEVDVLHQLFFVIGNGTEWANGQLTDGCETPEQMIETSHNEAIRHAEYEIEYSNKNGYSSEFWKEYKERQLWPPEKQREHERQYRRELLKEGEGTDCLFYLPDGSIGRYLYPLCEHARILSIPDNVQLDWLEAAERALSLVGTVLQSSPDRLVLDYIWLTKMRAHVTKCRESIKI